MVLSSKELIKYEESGKLMKRKNFGLLYGIALDPDQHVHLCSGSRGITVYDDDDDDWRVVTTYACAPVVLDARNVVIDPEGTVYVTRVQERSSKGTRYGINYINRNYQHISHIDMPSASTVPAFKLVENRFFLMADRPNHCIVMYRKDFNIIKSFGVKGTCIGELYEPSGVALTHDGELVVVGGNNYMQFF
jgi:DNA-binding beta-propeller fold protein YncE